MISLIKDMVYAIKTGDGRVKAYYSMALVAMVFALIGFIAAVVATIVCWAAGNKEMISLILGVAALVIFIVVFALMKKRQREA